MATLDNTSLSVMEHIPAGSPLRLVSVCLDSRSTTDLAEFIRSVPLVHFQAGTDSYPSSTDGWVERVRVSGMDVCLIDFDKNRVKAGQSAEIIHAQMPDTAVFALSADAQPGLIIQAMRCGCSEYLTKPLQQEQLQEATLRILGRRKEKPASGGQVLVFLGTKGGVGVTTVATHLGTLLAHTCSRQTLLVDLHQTFGDAVLYLGLAKQYKYSFRQLAESTERLDSELLQGFILHHHSGLQLLPAPEPSELFSPLDPTAIGRLIDFLRTRYEFVLIDCPPGTSQENLQALQRADQIYVITVAEVPALRNVVRYKDYFLKSGFPGDVRIMLNRHSKRDPITDEQIEKAIRSPVFWRIPNQYKRVIQTINDGDPSQMADSEVVRSLTKCAEQIASGPAATVAEAKGSRGFLGLLGG